MRVLKFKIELVQNSKFRKFIQFPPPHIEKFVTDVSIPSSPFLFLHWDGKGWDWTLTSHVQKKKNPKLFPSAHQKDRKHVFVFFQLTIYL